MPSYVVAGVRCYAWLYVCLGVWAVVCAGARAAAPSGPSARPEAYFNGSSYIRLARPVSLKQLVGLSFRTCVDASCEACTDDRTCKYNYTKVKSIARRIASRGREYVLIALALTAPAGRRDLADVFCTLCRRRVCECGRSVTQCSAVAVAAAAAVVAVAAHKQNS
ncbi:hypothetical protein RR46_08772 [Papilio xuthus]|uniref:Uncharacterized protein n=1 Tax=Papilio xuthus TaxID=66420 RepID=A0A194PQS5_PAPXU|nr:hypothetical protein RR46_08772 [Papilio xuthus]